MRITPSQHNSLLVALLSCTLLLLAPHRSTAAWKVKQDNANDDKQKRQQQQQQQDIPVEYGVDVSFPMHYPTVTTNYADLPHNLDPSLPTPPQYEGMPIQPLGNRQAFYKDFIDGCVEHFGEKGQRCLDTERDRVEMSLRQPQSMTNYTAKGYKKIRAPDNLFQLLSDFWNKNQAKAKTEQWGIGNTYTNNWKSPTAMVSVEDSGLRGGGYALKQTIWDAAKEIISEWTGQELTQCSLYGIRVYRTDAVLATHVDRLPLVSSAIINVAQDVDEPWPLEVIGHDGRAENVTMEPGDMVLYESHSVLHGRPFPLKGRFMANIFVHFEPTGHTLKHHNIDRADLGYGDDANKRYKDSLDRGFGGHENDNSGTGLPPYIIPGTPEEEHWRAAHPQGHKSKRTSSVTGSTVAHAAAQKGNVEVLQKEIQRKKEIVNARDQNGWTPMHEAVRGGHLEVVKLLVENGGDVDAKTYSTGGTVLWWAKQALSEDHPVVEFLESMGALEAGPEL